MTQTNRYNTNDWPQLKTVQEYMDGSAAPALVPEEAPARRTPSRKAPSKQVDPEREKRRHQQRRRAKLAKHNNRVAAFYFVLAVAAACTMLVTYIKIQSQTTIYLRSIANLEQQIESIKAENDATQIRLATATSLDEVKVKAEEKGMTYADDSRIVYFDIEKVDDMSQYAKMN